jgi:acyl dehydratase
MRYFEDYVPGTVHDLGSHRVTAEEIVEFGTAFDPQPYHVDEAAGRDSPFQGLVASGWHTASLFMRLYVTALLNDSAAVGSPGVDELRWLHPVRPGDTLHGRLTILSGTTNPLRPASGILRKRGELLTPAGTPLLRLTLFSIVLHRPAASSAPAPTPTPAPALRA